MRHEIIGWRARVSQCREEEHDVTLGNHAKASQRVKAPPGKHGRQPEPSLA